MFVCGPPTSGGVDASGAVPPLGEWVGDAFAHLDPDPDHVPEPPPGLPDLDDLAESIAASGPPGPTPSAFGDDSLTGWLALELDAGTTDPTALSDHSLIDNIVAFEKLSSWAIARQIRLLAEFGRRRPGDGSEAVRCDTTSVAGGWAPDEIGLALTLSRGAATLRLDHANRLTAELTPTLRLLENGELDAAKARAICFGTALLPPEKAVAVQNRVLPKAPRQTLQQLRAALSRAVIAADPRGAAERYRRSRSERRVRVADEGDGMGSLWALLAAPDAVAAYEWLSRLARSLGQDDPRGMDARRADLLVDLLTGRLELHNDGLGHPEPSVDSVPDLDGAADPDPDPDPDPDVVSDLVSESSSSLGPIASGSETTGRSGSASGTECASGAEPARASGRPDPAGGVEAVRSRHSAGDTEGEDGDDGDDADAGVADHVLPGRGLREPGESESSRKEPDDTERPTPQKTKGKRCTWQPLVRRPAAAAKPLVHVIIPYSTLTGADDQPCELSGFGPIPADLAREVAADAVWKRLLVDPLSGAVLDHSRNTYRPPAALADFVRARDGVCRSPICTRRAINCELDHIIPWAKGGDTSERNLMDGCTHDHHLKHQPGWKVRMLDGGVIEWTTPTGHRYRSDPHDYRPLDDRDPPLVRRAGQARHHPHADPFTGGDHAPETVRAAGRNPGHEPGDADRTESSAPSAESLDPIAEYEDRVKRERLADRTGAGRQQPPRTMETEEIRPTVVVGPGSGIFGQCDVRRGRSSAVLAGVGGDGWPGSR
jgi:hypothetical protein